MEYDGVFRTQAADQLTSVGLERGALESPAVPDRHGLVPRFRTTHKVSYFYSFQGRSLGQSLIHLW